MSEETGQPQRLETVFSIGIHQLRVAGQQTDDVVDLAGGGGFENVNGDSFIREERSDSGFVAVGSNQDRADSIFFGVDQDGVLHQKAFHLILIASFDRVEKLFAHGSRLNYENNGS